MEQWWRSFVTWKHHHRTMRPAAGWRELMVAGGGPRNEVVLLFIFWGSPKPCLFLCHYNHHMSHEKKESIHFTMRKNVKKLTKFDRFWRSSLSSKQPNLGAQCCGSCKGGTEWDGWVPKSAGVVSHSSWGCPTKIPLQRRVSDFKLSFWQCM